MPVEAFFTSALTMHYPVSLLISDYVPSTENLIENSDKFESLFGTCQDR